MSDTTGRRGRPKGSGIDDGQRLQEIARMIAADPALKPTTAIRSMGVSDPSVIRRLRDKFNAVRGELMEELRSSAESTRRARSRPSRAPAAGAETTAQGGPPSANAPVVAAETARARSIAAAAAKPAARVSERQAPAAKKAKSKDSKGASRDGDPPQNPSASRQAGADDEGAPREPRAAATDLPHSRDQRPLAFGQQDLYMSWMRAGLAATNMMLAAQAAMAREIVRTPYVSLALRQQMALGEWAMGFMPLARRTLKTAN